MGLETIHWFTTSNCNLNCNGCFRDRKVSPYCDSGKAVSLAGILADNGVTRIILGGGEPLLVPWIDHVGRILSKEGAYVSLHTNGLLLSPDRMKRLVGVVNGVALPIDSVNEGIQAYMRGEEFLPVLRKMSEMTKQLKNAGMDLGFHTYFTDVNKRSIPSIYNFIQGLNFDSWRVYEYNEDLAGQSFFDSRAALKYNDSSVAYKSLDSLRNVGNPEKGGTDCLLANFLFMERRMKQYCDNRVQFIAVREPKPSYAFLENNGDVMFYAWFSGNERRVVGNLFRDGFQKVSAKWNEMDEKGLEYDAKAQEDWVAAKFGDVPLWARFWEGAYAQEDLDAMHPRYHRKFGQLVDMYNQREEKMERSMAPLLV